MVFINKLINFFGNINSLDEVKIIEAGQIKANYTGLEIVGVSSGTETFFDISTATVNVSPADTTKYPKSAPNKDYTDLFDLSRNDGLSTYAGRLIENPISGQTHFWRFEIEYFNKSTNNVGELGFSLSNPASGFRYNVPINLPSVTDGKANGTAISIADAASIPSPNGYVLSVNPSFNDGNMIVRINSITRISLAFGA